MKSELGCSAYRKRRGRELRLTSEVAIMSRRGLSIAVLCLTCLGGSVSAQTNNGYVGVFGDAAGTIRCMTAPPGLPTTLYVVARTAGVTANGITGAEFRVEVANPSGYLFSYAAPESAVTIGDPVGATGLNIAFPSCRASADSIISLGTIAVFNTGSGGQTDIIVKRRNPPTNADYPCALFTQCDPAFTKACMTAPADSHSCLTQKPGADTRVLSSDELVTSLEGEAPNAGSLAYYGCVVNTFDVDEYDNVEATIKYCPIMVIWEDTALWVGMDSNHFDGWLQSGWRAENVDGVAVIDSYVEFQQDDGGHLLYPVGIAPSTSGLRYAVEHRGNDAVMGVGGVEWTVDVGWAGFDDFPMTWARFSSEMKQAPDDHVPGTGSQPCSWSNASMHRVTFGTFTPDFSNVQFIGSGGSCSRNQAYYNTGGAPTNLVHPKGVLSGTLGYFEIHDSRDP